MSMLKIKSRAKSAISSGSNVLYELIKTYAKALTDESNIYDYAWYTLYRYVTGSVNIYDIRSKLNAILANPRKLADDYQKSTGALILLAILERLNALDDISYYSNLDVWLSELEKRKWYCWDKTLMPIEFISFSRLSRIVNPSFDYEKLESEKPNQYNIRFLLYYHFALSFDSNECNKAKSFIDEIIEKYKGLIFDEIVSKEDIEYIALYMYLLARFGYYSEIEEVYSTFDRILIEQLVNTNWILKAIKTARDISVGLEDLDVVAISPEEINIVYPKVLYLSLIAMYEAGFSRVFLSTPEIVKKIQKLREKDIVGVDPVFIKLYRIYTILLVALAWLLAVLSHCCGLNLFISAFIGGLPTLIIFLINRYFKEPKTIDLR